MRSQSLLQIVSLLASIHASSADDATTISSIGCVDPSAFESCLYDANESQTQCAFETAGNTVESAACGLGFLINEMQCYFDSCWNKVYSCEYQSLVNQYQGDRGLVAPEEVPFWPAPDDALGRCSCNLGDLYVNNSASAEGIISLCIDTLDVTASEECSCCGYSAVLAAYYGICPTTDPDQVDYASLLEGITGYESSNGVNCSDIIASTNCATKWGFFSPFNGQYPDPAVGLPPNGTQPLSTTAGSLTSPPGGATFTWSLLGATYTATAAPYDEKNVEATSSGDVTATSTDPGDNTASPTTSGHAATVSGASKSTSTKATSTIGSPKSNASSAAATSAAKTSRAAKVQSLASLDITLFALLIITAYIS